MTMPAVEFESVGNQLHLVYRPRDDTDWVHRKFQRGEELVIKGTFHLTHEKLVENDVDPVHIGNTSELDPEGSSFDDEISMAFIFHRKG